MGLNRRDFLKIAGISGLMGLGGKAALEVLRPGELEAALPKAPPTAAKHWAMVIDTRKLKTEEEMQRCIEACHRTHNVPKIPSAKEEIKWIWTEPYKNAFPDDEHEHLSEAVEHKKVSDLLQPLHQPALRPGLPDQGHVQTGRRDRHDGLSPLHRLPVLHGRLSLRFPEFQLGGPAPLPQGTHQSGFSHPLQRGGGEM